MRQRMLADLLGWGFALWLVGYVLGLVLYFAMPAQWIGWVILPVGVAVTLWVLVAKIPREAPPYYLGLAVGWTLMAILLDYLLIVKALHPADGYYKADVYLYYALTFLLPIAVGGARRHASPTQRPAT